MFVFVSKNEWHVLIYQLWNTIPTTYIYPIKVIRKSIFTEVRSVPDYRHDIITQLHLWELLSFPAPPFIITNPLKRHECLRAWLTSRMGPGMLRLLGTCLLLVVSGCHEHKFRNSSSCFALDGCWSVIRNGWTDLPYIKANPLVGALVGNSVCMNNGIVIRYTYKDQAWIIMSFIFLKRQESFND